MSTFAEIGELPEKYRKHYEALVILLRKYDIDGLKAPIAKDREDPLFKKDWTVFWTRVAKNEGGKLSLTSAGIIIGASLGGVGVAAMGGAIGMPLALVLGLGGFLGGSKFDSLKLFSAEKKVTAKISKECFKALEDKADGYGISVNEYVKLILESEVAHNLTSLSN